MHTNFTPVEPLSKYCTYQHSINMFHIVQLRFTTIQYKFDVRKLYYETYLTDTKYEMIEAAVPSHWTAAG